MRWNLDKAARGATGLARCCSSVRRLFVPCLFIGCIGGASPLAAHDTLRLQNVEVIPGSEFEVDLLGSFDRPIRGFQVGVDFPQYAMSFLGVTLEGTDLDGTIPEVLKTATSPGEGTIQLILDATAPFENGIPAGESVRLARLRFRAADALSPGTVYTLTLESGLGIPPLTALIYAGSGSAPPSALEGGQVKVTDRNVLRIRDQSGVRPGSTAVLEISAFNISPLQGFSLCIQFDPAVVRFLEVDLRDTITEAVGAEYVAPIIDNQKGHLLLGVLLDSIPPFQNQVIPAAGLDLTIAKARVQVLDVPQGVESIDLALVDGLGAPPIRNLFVIDNQGIEPVKQNGRMSLISEGPFLRGDVNGDGRLDISDPIAAGDWLFRAARQLECHKAADADDDGDADLADMVRMLLFLFDRGAMLPQPYPAAGLDPTPDDLPCPN